MSKVCTLQQAVQRYIRDGCCVVFGGFVTNRRPYAVVYEMLRQRVRDLILIGGPAGGDADMLIGERRVRAYINSYTANSGYSNVSRMFRRAVEQNQLTYEDYTLDVHAQLLHAAAMGLPYLPTRCMVGSDLERQWGIDEEERRRIPGMPAWKCLSQANPFRPEERVLLVPVPEIDVGVVHVQKATPDGLARIEGGLFSDLDVAIAARHCIVTCEELVSEEELARDAEYNSIPSFVVSAVVHAPYGAHPTQVFNRYDYDTEMLQDYDACSKSDDAFHRFLEEWVYGVENHDEYLEKLGAARLQGLRLPPRASRRDEDCGRGEQDGARLFAEGHAGCSVGQANPG